MTKENVKELENKLELQIIKTEELENKLKLQIIKNEELENKLKLQIIKNEELESKLKLQIIKTEELENKTKELENKTKELENKTKELENKTKELKNKTKELENKTKELENKSKEPSINWCKNDLILYCKNNYITGYSNLSKIKLIELIHNKNLIKKDKYENKSPLRYPGGKSRACKNLDMILNNNFNISDFNTIISPFFGGGSFEFFLQNKYKLKIIANDKFTPLFNFWYNVKNNNNELVNKIKLNLNKIDKNKFIFFRNQILHENNILSQSVMYFIINRCSFSGSTLSGGFSKESSIKRFTESSCDRIEKMNLENFEIFNLDFQDFLEKNNNSLIFLDPPYYLENKSNLYGNNGDMHENFDHVKLYNYISNQKKWIMTYNNCEYIKKLYNKFKIIETNWTYGMNTSKKSNEIVIIG